MTIGELQAGVEITREQDPAKADEIESWVDRVASTRNVRDFKPFGVETLNPFAKPKPPQATD